MASRINADQFADSPGTGAPTFPYGAKGLLQKYFFGFFPISAQWGATSASFVDPTIGSGSNTLTAIYSNGLTIAAAATNILGVTITPSASGALYLVNFGFGIQNTTNEPVIGVRLTDGTTVVGSTGMQLPSGTNCCPSGITSLYVAPSGSAFTLKLQTYTQAGTTNLFGATQGTSGSLGIQVMVIQLA